MILLLCLVVLALGINGVTTAESLQNEKDGYSNFPSSLPEGSTNVVSANVDNEVFSAVTRRLKAAPVYPKGSITSKLAHSVRLPSQRADAEIPQDLQVQSQFIITLKSQHYSANQYSQWREKVLVDGGACNESIQCKRKSVCHEGYCRCLYGYNGSCVYNKYKHGNPNLFLPVTVIISIATFSVALCSISGFLLYRRFFKRAQSPCSQRERTISETCAQSIDKPPAYDEVTSISAATVALSIEELSEIPPPSYESLRQSQQPTTSVSN